MTKEELEEFLMNLIDMMETMEERISGLENLLADIYDLDKSPSEFPNIHSYPQNSGSMN